MATLSENDITTQFAGHSAHVENLARCAHKNRETKEGTEYIVYSCGFLYDQELRELFGVTDKLKDLWERRGTEFNVYLYITDGQLPARYSNTPNPVAPDPPCLHRNAPSRS